MTVLEPTPDRAARWALLRRVGFAATGLALSAAFALSLSGIATTRGAVRPDGQAAAIAAQQQRIASAGGDDRVTGRHHCHRGTRGRSGTSSSGRV
ncbi:MAG: hypothetical protein QOH72_707 [Solirubrobacteraceae bacterium]|jgi:hypothetical protein|nr:hypothetical protein [Solirubrobacteraceae bacterium]